tara:strand:- start:688 stop:1230 length:543 start_codon:yes stop_codon:yes gene_type:complete
MNGRHRLNWPETAIKLAYHIAEYRSEDPWVQVGAVGIKYDKSLILGYNGAPSGANINWSDRDERRPYVLHAEENVLNFAKPGEIEILAVTHLPCEHCIKLIAQKKIKRVYYSEILPNYNKELTISIAEKFHINLIQLCLPSKKSSLKTALSKKPSFMVLVKKLWKILVMALQSFCQLLPR